jgi:hypothetical protein
VHWQAGERSLPAVQITVAGESALWVDPAEIPANEDIGKLGLALASGTRGERYELMANSAAYTGLRWGEPTALTIAQVDQAARTITVDRKSVEVGGRLYLEARKNRKHRRTIYPRRTPAGYPLAERLTGRIEEARAEQEAGDNPLGLIFPPPKGTYWRSSNFNRRVLAPTYLAAGWRDADGNGSWTWHSLRHRSGRSGARRKPSGNVPSPPKLLITGQAEPSLRDLPLHSRPATTTPPSMTSPGKPGSPPDGTLTTEHDTAITNLDSSIT